MNLVIIGYGGMGEYHARCLKKYSDSCPAEAIRVAGVYDIDRARAAAAEKEGLKVYRAPGEIWTDQTADAVLIATPNDSHAEYVKAAAGAKKNVICEKPAGMSSREAEEMYDAAERAGILLEVHQNRRWDEDFLTAKRIVESGLVGAAYRIESRVMGGNGIPGAWRTKKAHGGGMMLDWGVHLVDQMFQMIPSPVKSLWCEYSYIYGEEVDDGFTLAVDFENGVRYRIVVATDCFRSLPRWQVYGTEGTASIADWSLSGGVTRVLVRDGEMPAGIQAGNGFTRTMAPRMDDTVEEKPLPVVRAEPFAFYRNFAAACAGKAPAAIRREEVVRVCKLMEAAERSARENAVIKEKI